MSYQAQIARLVRRYVPADRAALREFQTEYFGAHSRQCDDRYFEWLFEQNPYQEAGKPTLWLCKNDGVVLGQQASIPCLVKVGDVELKAGWGIDLMVRNEWRLKGVAPALSAAYEESAEVLLGAAMSEAAHRAFLRRGWTDRGMLSFRVRPLDPEACAQTTHAPRVLTKLTPQFAARGSAYAAGVILGRLTGSSLEPITSFDERVDAVWSTASTDYGVLVRRDFKYLHWRFDLIPGETAYQRHYLKRKGQVVGYAVTRLEQWRGNTVARLVDYLAPRALLSVLFALVLREMNSQGVAVVFIEQLHQGAERVLRSLGCFRARASTRFIFNVRGSAAPFRNVLNSAESWLLNLADSDLDHEASYRPALPSEHALFTHVAAPAALGTTDRSN